MTNNPKYSSREAQAMAEIGQTTIRPGLARLLTMVFLFAIGIVPLTQQVADIRDWQAGRRASPRPQCYDIFRNPPGVAPAIAQKGMPLVRRVIAANRALMRAMRAYEEQLENDSVVDGWVRAPTQYILTRWLGAGNDKTYCGRGEWLFYRPDIDYVINHGFLEKGVMARRAASGPETAAAPQPDPRPAIIAFNTELAARGIRLILMPTPVKPVIHPEKFAAGFENAKSPVQNSSYRNFIKGLESAGVLVFDPAQMLVGDKLENKGDQFLAGDTHWRPEAMELCARLLSGFIKQNVHLATEPMVGYTSAGTNIVQRGDIVAMLRLPERGEKYGAENVCIRQIFEPDGRPWQSSKEADILVLGDSFANVYSLTAMGWGANAGLVEQLSYEMDRKIDRITVNDNGAWAAREQLMRELAGGKDRLVGKRAVIWQFAVRELTEGDWKILPLRPGLLVVGFAEAGLPAEAASAQAGPGSLPPATTALSKFIKLSAGSKLNISGTIKTVTRAPRPGSVPYADHIITVHLANVSDNTNDYGQALVYLMSMTNHVLTKAAGLRVGDTVSMRLRPWSEVSTKYERINRTDLDDPELLVQEPCWGELLPDK